MAKRRKTTKRDPAVEAMERARSTRQTQAARVKPPGKIRRPARGPSHGCGPSHGRGSTPLADLRNRLNLSDTASAYDVAASALVMIDDLEHQLANPPQTSPLDLCSTASLKDF